MLSMIWGLVLLGAALGAFFVLGIRLLSGHLVQQYSRRHSHSIRPLLARSLSSVEVVFAVTLALSLQLFLLLVLQIAGCIDGTARWLFWRLSLTMLLVTLGIVIPLLLIRTVVLGGGLVSGRKLTVLVFMFAVYLVAFQKLGHLLPLLSSGTSPWTLDFWGGRIGVIGVALMSMLSGFAAADKPIRVFCRPNTGRLRVPAGEAQIKGLWDAIAEKRQRLDRLNREAELRPPQDPIHRSSVLGRLYTSILAAVGGDQPGRLMAEISALEALHARASLEASYAPGRTLSVKRLLVCYGDTLGAVYCVYRIASVAFNVFVYRVSSADPVSWIAGLFLHFLNVRLDVQYCSMQFTLWSIGVLVWCSLKAFLGRLMSYLTLFSPFDSADASLLVMSYVAGVYFVSSVLTLKNSLPAVYGGIISDVLPGLNFDHFTHCFDVVFLLSVCVSSAFLVLQRNK